ncbi:uncharacterized protein EV422DRAFT_123669 [Fimicolochytrium jonesii]|uniref:uncharacterized protein n=1 Tax=Fimicolochytrium jonesii TaxID=1396493 RepID=UPI0022FF2293|nr:uncharacterized protein EV422DRAFT_123669 [Fimicolochytrium jonesii]KAI8818873.1 hypothetical protein EV422DRAFT_123669 [Fimicolochytrium jonesii]
MSNSPRSVQSAAGDLADAGSPLSSPATSPSLTRRSARARFNPTGNRAGSRPASPTASVVSSSPTSLKTKEETAHFRNAQRERCVSRDGTTDEDLLSRVRALGLELADYDAPNSLVGELGWHHLLCKQLFARVPYEELPPATQTLLAPFVLPEAHTCGTLLDVVSFTKQEKAAFDKSRALMGVPWMVVTPRTESVFQIHIYMILREFFDYAVNVNEKNKVPYACMPGYRLGIPDIAANCRGAALDSGLSPNGMGHERFVPAAIIGEVKGDVSPVSAEPQLASYLGGQAVMLLAAGVPADQVYVVGFTLGGWQVVFGAVTVRPNPDNPAAAQLVYTRVLDFGRLDLESSWQATGVARMLVALARLRKDLEDKLQKDGGFLFRAAADHFDTDDEADDDDDDAVFLAASRCHEGSDETVSSSALQGPRSKYAEVLDWVAGVGAAHAEDA